MSELVELSPLLAYLLVLLTLSIFCGVAMANPDKGKRFAPVALGLALTTLGYCLFLAIETGANTLNISGMGLSLFLGLVCLTVIFNYRPTFRS